MVDKLKPEATPLLQEIEADPLLRTRREKLQQLTADHGGPVQLAQALGYSAASFMVQMTGPNPTRKVTEKTARAIETKLKLPKGYLDGKEVAVQAPAVVDANMAVETATLVHQICGEMRITLTPSKFRNIVTLAYQDAVQTGAPRTDMIRQLLQLAM